LVGSNQDIADMRQWLRFSGVIGEAIYYYQASGRKASTGFLAKKFRVRYREGRAVAADILQNKIMPKSLH